MVIHADENSIFGSSYQIMNFAPDRTEYVMYLRSENKSVAFGVIGLLIKVSETYQYKTD